MSFEKIHSRPRVFQQLTGLTVAAFETLLPDCEQADDDDCQPRDQQRPGPRQRRPGGGAKGALPTPADELLFLLPYFRQDPTRETLASLFGFSQGQACPWIHRLTPIVDRALGAQLHLPARRPAPIQEVLASCPGLEFLIDGTERPTRRPKGRQRRRDDESGQKERHTKKDLVITDQPGGKVVGLGPTPPGRRHDRACADDDGVVFPEGSTLSKDTGFQGYEPEGVATPPPRKEPRGRELTPEEKASNRLSSRIRVQVEHSLGGIKVFRIAQGTSRNLKGGFVDLVMGTTCG